MRHLVTAGLVLFWILLVVAAVFAEAFLIGPPRIARGDFAAIEKHLVGELRDAKIGSAALVLLRDGRVAAAHAFGIEKPDPDRTRFQVASVSKAVTAWGVMKLVQDGRIALDEPVVRHLRRWRFPGSERHRDRVTVRHLLSHTAGLDDGLGYRGSAPGERVPTLEKSLAGIVIAREPGAAMAYSGASYAILQLLIEEVTGQSFATYTKTAVLDPLGMTRSTFDLPPNDVVTTFDRDLNRHPTRRYTATAAVSLFATANDLARFAAALAGPNPVLTRDTMATMLAPQRGTGDSWALGHTLYGGPIAGHDGGTYPALGAVLRVNRANGDAIVLMGSGANVAMSLLGDHWVQWETGLVRAEARRQMIYDRAGVAGVAGVAMVVGAIGIVVWRRLSCRA